MKYIQMMTLLAAFATQAAANDNSCVREIISSKESQRYFPSLAEQAKNNQFDQRTLDFLAEASRFCECHSRAPASASPFPDTQAILAHEDACAGKNLMGDSFEVHYSLAQTKLSQEISRRLQQRYPRAIRQLASTNSYNQKMTCLHESILSRCSRSKSLQMSYQCILQVTTSRDFSTLEAKCPEFSDESQRISDNHDLMI